MYPQHILGDKRDFTEFVKKPVGSGPFIRTEATPGSAWKVRRYDGYHGKDARGQALPYLDGIDYTPIVDFSQTAAALRTGRIDLATAFDARIVVDILDELKGSLKYEFFSGPGVRFDIALRNKAPFDNKRVRQAISMGIDRKLILDSVEKGRGIWQPPPLVAPEQGGVWGLPRTELEKLPGFRQPHTADFNEAVRILRAEGVREGTPFNYIVFQTFVQSGETDVVLTELKKLGFNPTPVIFSSGPEIIARVSSGNFDGWRQAAAVNFDDPSQSITPFMATGAGRNYTNFSIPDLDRLLDEQDRTLDFAKRRDLMWQLQRAILDDASTIPIHYGETLFGWPPYVKNHPKWVFSFGPQWRYDTVWLDK
jgi:ABC-type transport system substrate-binding protein